MKKTLLVAVMMLFVASSVLAEVSGSVSTKYLPKYTTLNGYVVHDGAVQQTDIYISLPKGFYTDLWISLPWNGQNNLGKEVDWTLGWSGALGTIANLDCGISYFDYIDLFHKAGDIINPYVKVSRDFELSPNQTLSPYLRMELPFPVSGGDPLGGQYTFLGIKHTWKAAKRVSLSQEVYAVYDNGVYGLEKGWIGKYNATLSAEIIKSTSLDFSVSVFSPLTSLSDRETEFVPGVGFTYSF